VCYDSIGDYAHGDGYMLTRIYIPQYDLYCNYYPDGKRFVAYKSTTKFNECDKNYKNVRKIKLSSSFANYMYDIYEIDENTKKWSEQNKDYFAEVVKHS
jgi:hypothetical protein